MVLVVAFHASLGYADFGLRLPMGLVPVADAVQWTGLTVIIQVLDVFFMALLFLISGLFVWPGLVRDGAVGFARRRALRLGLPFVLGLVLIMPPAYYPAYVAAGLHLDFFTFWGAVLWHGPWSAGPLWFLWLLLFFDLVAAAIYGATPKARRMVASLAAKAASSPIRTMVGLILCGCLAYLPLLLLFGPFRWVGLGPFGFQVSRPLHYAVYFFAGVAIGTDGLNGRLLGRDRPLARHWPWWLLSAGLVQALWVASGPLIFVSLLLWGLEFLVTSAVTSFALLALSRRFGLRRSALGDSFAKSSFGIYVLHYFFVLWAQYLFVGAALPAWLKAIAVTVGAVTASWGCTELFSHLSSLGGRRRPAGPEVGASEAGR